MGWHSVAPFLLNVATGKWHFPTQTQTIDQKRGYCVLQQNAVVISYGT